MHFHAGARGCVLTSSEQSTEDHDEQLEPERHERMSSMDEPQCELCGLECRENLDALDRHDADAGARDEHSDLIGERQELIGILGPPVRFVGIGVGFRCETHGDDVFEEVDGHQLDRGGAHHAKHALRPRPSGFIGVELLFFHALEATVGTGTLQLLADGL